MTFESKVVGSIPTGGIGNSLDIGMFASAYSVILFVVGIGAWGERRVVRAAERTQQRCLRATYWSVDLVTGSARVAA